MFDLKIKLFWTFCALLKYNIISIILSTLFLKGVPGKGKFTTLDQLIETITSVIYISSVAHASVNFLQYEQYGFPFNYPAMLYGDPPRRKIEVSFLPDFLSYEYVLSL